MKTEWLIIRGKIRKAIGMLDEWESFLRIKGHDTFSTFKDIFNKPK